jgi:hypothetical protein
MKHKGLHVMKRFSFSADLPQPGHILRASQKRKNLKQSLSHDAQMSPGAQMSLGAQMGPGARMSPKHLNEPKAPE